MIIQGEAINPIVIESAPVNFTVISDLAIVSQKRKEAYLIFAYRVLFPSQQLRFEEWKELETHWLKIFRGFHRIPREQLSSNRSDGDQTYCECEDWGIL